MVGSFFMVQKCIIFILSEIQAENKLGNLSCPKGALVKRVLFGQLCPSIKKSLLNNHFLKLWK
ncbi:hypothetical protein D3C81_1317310 [compost metagenome]